MVKLTWELECIRLMIYGGLGRLLEVTEEA